MAVLKPLEVIRRPKVPEDQKIYNIIHPSFKLKELLKLKDKLDFIRMSIRQIRQDSSLRGA